MFILANKLFKNKQINQKPVALIYFTLLYFGNVYLLQWIHVRVAAHRSHGLGTMKIYLHVYCTWFATMYP